MKLFKRKMIKLSTVFFAFAAAFASLGLVTQYGGFYIAALLCLIVTVGLDKITEDKKE